MKHFAFLAIFLMALVAMPVIAAEPAGPPGFSTEVLIGSYPFEMTAQVTKEATPIDLDAVAVSTYAAINAFDGTVSPNANTGLKQNKYFNAESATFQPFYLVM